MSSFSSIRNFCIIAHIDHGKSTLADRMLELTNTVPARQMQPQLLDQMDLERERGITIKLQPVKMRWTHGGNEHVLHLIDTPGHVDFSYEVSRSLAAVEGAVLLVDATQGVQAQTLANLYLALEQNLAIIPVINKIDLPNADVAKARSELVRLLGCPADDIILASGKTGAGVPDILSRIVEIVPAPSGHSDRPARALIFDSMFDEYRGVIAYVRVVDGRFAAGTGVTLVASRAATAVSQLGTFSPLLTPLPTLSAGEIGWLALGLKDLTSVRVGDTITLSANAHTVEALPGYREPTSVVFAGFYTQEGELSQLREAMEKLKLNDAALTYEPEHFPGVGFGFRVGFLGMLHLEIVRERLEREFKLPVTVTTPSVAYHVRVTDGSTAVVRRPQELPDPTRIETIEEPWATLDIIIPKEHVGPVSQLVDHHRGEYRTTEYLDETVALLHYDIPLVSLIVDFYDRLKSATAGYGSMTYEFSGYRAADVVKLDILVAGEKADPLSTMVWRDEAYRRARGIVERLAKVLPRQLFEVKIQAALGGKIIASDQIPPLRKDVTAKLYGGDVTRKRKLLEKQKKGKKRMAGTGRVEIPSAAYLELLKRE